MNPSRLFPRLSFCCCAVLVCWQVSAQGAAAISLKLVAEGFTAPAVLLSLPGSKGELLVADQIGVVSIVKADGNLDAAPFLDLRSRLTVLRKNFDERGLLGLAAHPKFARNGKLYACYSAPLRAGVPTNWNHTMHVSEFTVKRGARSIDLATERVVLQIDKPSFNHNGGRIAFGPDGYLYVGVGDGGEGLDRGIGHAPEGNGQNKDTLLAKILRIDVNHSSEGRAYAIPQDNPFARGGGRPEIFAWGIRNPWGISFDRGGKHELFASDVGQSMWEEVNLIVRGGNYGWRLREGFIGFDPDKPKATPEQTPLKAVDGAPLLDPIITYMNAAGHAGEPGIKGTSITGGYVYRGRALPELKGRYVFADWSKSWGVPVGTLLVATRPKSSESKTWELQTLAVEGAPNGEIKGFIPALGEDADGELYLLTSQRNILDGTTGKVFKLVPAAQ